MKTIYIAPAGNQCNVYLIPYGMRPGQSPADIDMSFRHTWEPIGQLDHTLAVRWLEDKAARWREDIAGQMAGTYFEVSP